MLLLALYCVAAILVLVWARRRFRGVERFFGSLESGPVEIPDGETRRRDRAWAVGGLVLLGAALTFLEWRFPYFFTQDDVLVGEMPSMLFGCRSLWRGVFPDYNPFVMMGAPEAGYGGASLTYPPTYLAYAIARHLLSDEYAFAEVFAAIHLGLGYLVTFRFLRTLGVGPAIAVLGSLSLLLSGGMLIMGRSWHTVTPIFLWLPLLLLCLVRLPGSKTPWHWIFGTGAVIGVYFHVGFPLFYFYALGAFGLVALYFLVSGAVSLRRLSWIISAVLVGLAIASPLLLVISQITGDLVRWSGYGNGIAHMVRAIFLPYPLVQASHPNSWGSTDLEVMGHLLYSGTVFQVLFLVGLAGIVSRKPHRQLHRGEIWVLLALMFFVLSLGREGRLWSLLSQLPVVGRVNNHPFRMTVFLAFFSTVSGSLVLDRLLKGTLHRRFWTVCVTIVVLLLLGYHVGMSRTSFYQYGFKPYTELPRPVAEVLKPAGEDFTGRVLPVAPIRSVDPTYGQSLMHNMPDLFGVLTVGGYDPATEGRLPMRTARSLLAKTPLEGLRAYGTRWILVHRSAVAPIMTNPGIRAYETNVVDRPLLESIPLTELTLVVEEPALKMFELRGVDPLAFASGRQREQLPIDLSGAGIDVNLRDVGDADHVIVNFLWYPELEAAIDGEEVECEPDEWGRIKVPLSGQAERLMIRYRPGWIVGIALGLFLLLLSTLGAIWISRVEKRSACGPDS